MAQRTATPARRTGRPARNAASGEAAKPRYVQQEDGHTVHEGLPTAGTPRRSCGPGRGPRRSRGRDGTELGPRAGAS
eukprot:3269384-Lingulodinium_polyedra.AAC.1